jgi:hypothetical protein
MLVVFDVCPIDRHQNVDEFLGSVLAKDRLNGGTDILIRPVGRNDDGYAIERWMKR